MGKQALTAASVVALAAAQFGTIQIDWTSQQDGTQLPVVVGSRATMPEVPAEPVTRDRSQHERTLLAERDLVSALAEPWPRYERAQAALWEHWFGEEGLEARSLIEDAAQALDDPEAAGEAPQLMKLISAYPLWAEPINRLATLRFLQHRFDESIVLCERA